VVIVSNATPIIYLAKSSKLHLLREIFNEVYIPPEVEYEVVHRGKKLGIPDAEVVENAIKTGWIKVAKTELLEMPIALDPGEHAAISLAVNMKIKEFLIDESPARRAAKIMKLTPRGTIHILLEGLKEGILDMESFLKSMEKMIKEGFRLKEEIYLVAVRTAQKIEQDKLNL
jgi:predicted nucleic acid-binding protein